MKAFEATTVVQPTGEIRVTGVPFFAGTEVEVVVSPKRDSGEEFRRQWVEVCQKLRSVPAAQNITDDEIQAEVVEFRAQR
jgi:hypothetical protein